VRTDTEETSLGGLRSQPTRRKPLFEPRESPEAEAFAARLDAPPALDGTLAGFEVEQPLVLDSEHHYRRSETGYDPEAFNALAWINWDGEALYLAVQVAKPELCLFDPGAPARRLDNEPDDINADGIQVYWRVDEARCGVLVDPLRDGGLHVRPLPGGENPADLAVEGTWQQTESGYLVTLAIADRSLQWLGSGARIGFDLAVNEMHPERERRAGQLVWSGTEGGGWIYLRGDRHDWNNLGTLELG
jgi:hypothetical protein